MPSVSKAGLVKKMVSIRAKHGGIYKAYRWVKPNFSPSQVYQGKWAQKDQPQKKTVTIQDKEGKDVQVQRWTKPQSEQKTKSSIPKINWGSSSYKPGYTKEEQRETERLGQLRDNRDLTREEWRKKMRPIWDRKKERDKIWFDSGDKERENIKRDYEGSYNEGDELIELGDNYLDQPIPNWIQEQGFDQKLIAALQHEVFLNNGYALRKFLKDNNYPTKLLENFDEWGHGNEVASIKQQAKTDTFGGALKWLAKNARTKHTKLIRGLRIKFGGFRDNEGLGEWVEKQKASIGKPFHLSKGGGKTKKNALMSTSFLDMEEGWRMFYEYDQPGREGVPFKITFKNKKGLKGYSMGPIWYKSDSQGEVLLSGEHKYKLVSIEQKLDEVHTMRKRTWDLMERDKYKRPTVHIELEQIEE